MPDIKQFLSAVCNQKPEGKSFLALHPHGCMKGNLAARYVDGAVPVLSAMYAKRVRGYEAVGYQIQDDAENFHQQIEREHD